MSSNRYNRPTTPQPVDYSPKKKEKEEEIILIFEPCCVCNKKIVDGYYARWKNGGVCSRACDIVRENQPKDFGEPNHGNKIPHS